ncbi:MAG: CPBP family intramembrane glutamic endopeptidase [Alphaproteobacteria bacterium]
MIYLSRALRPAGLLVRLRLRRTLNQMQSALRFRLASPDKKATGRTTPVMWLLSGLVGLAMLGGFTMLSNQAIINIKSTLGSVQVQATAPPTSATDHTTSPQKRGKPVRRLLPPAPGTVLSLEVQRGAIFQVTLLIVAVLLVTVASRELARPEWDFEWLATLPLPLTTLLLCRLVERVVTSASGFFGLVPFLSVLAWTCGYRWMAPLLGLGLSIMLTSLVATAQMLSDTGLRLSLSPPRLRNLHAAISILSVPVPLLAMSMAMAANTFVFGWAAALPGLAMWLPPGLAVRMLAAADAGSALLWCALMIGEVTLLVAAGLVLLRRQLRDGVIAAGAREPVARKPRTLRKAEFDSRTGTHPFLSVVQRRELRLLMRDRTYMVQTLLFPALIVGMQVLLNPGAGFSLGLLNEPQHLAAIAFGVASYGLIFSAFQTLNAEGQSLWILYSVPHSLESVLRQKARLWMVVAFSYPLVMFAVAIGATGNISLQFAEAALVVLVGVPIFSAIATALGVFGCDPLEVDPQRRIRITYLYLYMLIASLYVYAIYAASIWQRLALVILTALVAIALWQKARDRFDYLLDPSASPPARVSVADGLIAALLFFVLQGLAGLMQMRLSGTNTPTAQTIWISFVIAGAATYGLARFVYWRMDTLGVPRIVGEGMPRALLLGMIGGIAASLVALAYLQIGPRFLPVPLPAKLSDPILAIGLVTVIIIAAPIFEEFIFRGLIFEGLRRSLGLGSATLASAAIFAIVHPPFSIVPVFVLGVCAALVYSHTRMLVAPMIVHAIYNTVIIGQQWHAIYE